jgi:hypothetical protein
VGQEAGELAPAWLLPGTKVFHGSGRQF